MKKKHVFCSLSRREESWEKKLFSFGSIKGRKKRTKIFFLLGKSQEYRMNKQLESISEEIKDLFLQRH